MLTPIEEVSPGYWAKRDDLFEFGGMRGGKVRTCLHLSQGAKGLVTAGSRSSPQCNIVAHIAAALGIPSAIHCPSGDLGPELEDAKAQGAEVCQHYPGWNSNIIAQAKKDAARRGWRYIPFGMECHEAIKQTASQVTDIPKGVKRIVIPVGSGMSLAGVLHGLSKDIPVLGVIVGADPTERLNKYAPRDWRSMCKLQYAFDKYENGAPWMRHWFGIEMDPIYEAKCIPYLEPGDLFWIVGIRNCR